MHILTDMVDITTYRARVGGFAGRLASPTWRPGARTRRRHRPRVGLRLHPALIILLGALCAANLVWPDLLAPPGPRPVVWPPCPPGVPLSGREGWPVSTLPLPRCRARRWSGRASWPRTSCPAWPAWPSRACSGCWAPWAPATTGRGSYSSSPCTSPVAAGRRGICSVSRHGPCRVGQCHPRQAVAAHRRAGGPARRHLRRAQDPGAAGTAEPLRPRPGGAVRLPAPAGAARADARQGARLELLVKEVEEEENKCYTDYEQVFIVINVAMI
jgi:hypothetical protein